MITKNETIAVVGASNNHRKYGYQVVADLISKDYHVIPINPKEENILEIHAFPELKHVKTKIDWVVFVVPPRITEKILVDVKKLKIPSVWMQPGSESDKAIKFCMKNNINCVHDTCIMLQ